MLKFPYEDRSVSDFGKIPIIKLIFEVEYSGGFLPMAFVFDTGAEVTSLPAEAAEKLGIDLNLCPKGVMKGYEGNGVTAYISKIRIKINNKVIAIPCVFHPNPMVPMLLGRAGIISRFNILLDAKNKQISLDEI